MVSNGHELCNQVPTILTHACCLEKFSSHSQFLHSDVTHAIRDTIPVIFLTYPAIANIIFSSLPTSMTKKYPGQMPYQNHFPNISGRKLHQIFYQVRIELFLSSLFCHSLGIPQHYSACNLIS